MIKHLMKKIRARVCDTAFPYRMGAGFAGDINRTHPVSVEPCLQHATTPAVAYGQAVLADTSGGSNTVRPFVAGDQALVQAYGITARPFPIQAPAGSSDVQQGYGGGLPPGAGNVIDVMRRGYIMVQLNTGEASPTKGAPVYVRTASTSGNHVQGGFETTLDGSNQAALDPGTYKYNGPADASGIVEISVV